MKFLKGLVCLLSLTLLPSVVHGVDIKTDLEAAVRGAGGHGMEWLVYSIDSERTDRFVCCYGWKDGEAREQVCRPEKSGGSWSVSDARRPDPEAYQLRLYLAVEKGEVRQAHTYSASCQVELTWPVRELTGVAQAQSLEVLRKLALASTDGNSHRRGQALAAIASHLAPGSVDVLAGLSEPGLGAKLREEALFWLGQTRTPLAVKVLSRRLDDEPSREMRKHILFSMSQTGVPEATDRIERAAERDVSPDVRSHGWFCLAQTRDPRAEQAILDATRDDPDSQVREGAVFALSQLPARRGVEALMRVLRTSEDGAVKRQALFWLAESGDPAAMEKISRLLD